MLIHSFYPVALTAVPPRGSLPDESSVRAVTMWVVCDLETETGRALLYDGVKRLVSTAASAAHFHIASRVTNSVRLADAVKQDQRC